MTSNEINDMQHEDGNGSRSACEEQNDVIVPEQSEGGVGLPQRYAISIARHPRRHLAASLLLVCALSAVGMSLGNFYVRVDASGWWSRSTPVADRATQERVLSMYGQELRRNSSLWDDLTSRELTNWQDVDKEWDDAGEAEAICNGTWYGSKFMTSPRQLNLVSVWRTRDAEAASPARSALEAEALYDLCLAEQRTLRLLEQEDLCHKCPTAGSQDVPVKCIQPYSLVSMARNYLTFLDWNFDYDADVLFELRSHFLTPDITCQHLRDRWSPSVMNNFTHILKNCTRYVSEVVGENFTPEAGFTQCPSQLFVPSVLDHRFPTTDPPLVRYTSSIFATNNDDHSIKALYGLSQSKAFDQSDGTPLDGLYDSGINSIYSTSRPGFYALYLDQIMPKDIGLSAACGLATSICILFHTKSPFLTFMGLLQIALSFPLAYFVYYFIAGLDFFPFVNFNAIFVLFSLGADDIFVAVDKWKNARIELHDRPVDEVAAVALPNAAYSMFVTSVTTAVAFFGTSVISVPAVECFGIFCGLVVTLDYILNILLVFPSLCLYDQWMLNGSNNILISMKLTNKINGRPIKSFVSMSIAKLNNDTMSTSSDEDDNQGELSNCNSRNKQGDIEQECVEALPNLQNFDITDNHGEKTTIAMQNNPPPMGRYRNDDTNHILIHSMLNKYYDLLHKLRWPLLTICIGITALCGYVTAKLKPTDQANPPFLPSSNPYEMHRAWSENLMSSVLFKGGYGKLYTIWGVIPADTGDRLNPDKWTKLVLDDDFDPTSEVAQNYLLGFCETLFQNRMASKETSDYVCPMNAFDAWLKEQSTSETPVIEYQNNCNGTTSVPVPPELFDQCIIAWSEYAEVSSIYNYKGKVKIITVKALTNTTYESPYAEQREEFLKLEDWWQNEVSNAPDGVNRFFLTSYDFWWYDTLSNMMASAYKSAGIAIACASVMIFLTSKSIRMMIFSGISIAYVILGATASLVGMGWTLGLFESILFAILVGIGCDFVIHLSHAYTMHPGRISKHDRTRFALLHMGPSVLASWATTMITAVIMMFTEIIYFRKFSIMLSMTMVHSFIGSFIILLTLCDCMGPSDRCHFFEFFFAE